MSQLEADRAYDNALKAQFSIIHKQDKRNYKLRVSTILALIQFRRGLIGGHEDVWKIDGTASRTTWHTKWKFQQWYMDIVERCYDIANAYDIDAQVRSDREEAKRFNELEKAVSLAGLESSLAAIKHVGKLLTQYERMNEHGLPAGLDDGRPNISDQNDGTDEPEDDGQLPDFMPPDKETHDLLLSVYKAAPNMIKSGSHVGRLARNQPTAHKVQELQGGVSMDGSVDVNHIFDFSAVLPTLSISQMEQLLAISDTIEKKLDGSADIIDIEPDTEST